MNAEPPIIRSHKGRFYFVIVCIFRVWSRPYGSKRFHSNKVCSNWPSVDMTHILTGFFGVIEIFERAIRLNEIQIVSNVTFNTGYVCVDL